MTASKTSATRECCRCAVYATFFNLTSPAIVELDRREDPTFDKELTGCPLVSSCTNI